MNAADDHATSLRRLVADTEADGTFNPLADYLLEVAVELDRRSEEIAFGIAKVLAMGREMSEQAIVHRSRQNRIEQAERKYAVLLGHLKALAAENARLRLRQRPAAAVEVNAELTRLREGVDWIMADVGSSSPEMCDRLAKLLEVPT